MPLQKKNHVTLSNRNHLGQTLRQKLKQKHAMGTLEVVIIIAVLLSVALIFREQISAFAEELMSKVFDSSILDQIG